MNVTLGRHIKDISDSRIYVYVTLAFHTSKSIPPWWTKWNDVILAHFRHSWTAMSVGISSVERWYNNTSRVPRCVISLGILPTKSGHGSCVVSLPWYWIKMSVCARSIVITGANRGIGLEMVRQLVSSDTPPQHLFATCRDPDAARVRII